MWFDARKARAEIERGRPAPATLATSATSLGSAPARVANVADVAAPQLSRSETRPEQDAAALLSLLEREGPQTYGAAAVALGIGATRAWRAEAELRRAGRIRLGRLGRAIVLNQAE